MSYDFEGKKVFLSGPMTGMPDWNREAFAEACTAVSLRGASQVYNPAAHASRDGVEAYPHEVYMLDTLHVLTGSLTDIGGEPVPYWDVLVALPGCEGSEGALVEIAVAEACGVDVVDWEEARG